MKASHLFLLRLAGVIAVVDILIFVAPYIWDANETAAPPPPPPLVLSRGSGVVGGAARLAELRRGGVRVAVTVGSSGCRCDPLARKSKLVRCRPGSATSLGAMRTSLSARAGPDLQFRCAFLSAAMTKCQCCDCAPAVARENTQAAAAVAGTEAPGLAPAQPGSTRGGQMDGAHGSAGATEAEAAAEAEAAGGRVITAAMLRMVHEHNKLGEQ
jgi:hypothetical protein